MLTRVFSSLCEHARVRLHIFHVYFHSVIFVLSLTPLPVCLSVCLSSPAEACGSKSVYDGPEQEEYSSFVIDDPQETYKTLKLIVSAVQTLEQQHTKYKRDKFKKTKIGSQYVDYYLSTLIAQIVVFLNCSCRI